MAETLQITVSRSETQIAIFEGQNLLEFRIEKSEEKVIGNVYLGVITRVLPGLAAAFVDIGLEQNAFLPMSDATLFPSQDSPNNVTGEKPGQTASVFSEGQQVLVQVKKDPIGNKGARLTTQISIPSRYLVLTSRTNSLGISQRIENETEKNSSALNENLSKLSSDGNKIAAGLSSSSDGENALSLIDLQSRLSFNSITHVGAGSGSFTFDEFYSSIVSDIGIQSFSTKATVDQQEGILLQLNTRRESVAGVSIDEEFINMVKFQQAFNASARLIGVVDELLDTLNSQV